MSRGGAFAIFLGLAVAACGSASRGDGVPASRAGPEASTSPAARLAAACSGCHAGTGAAIVSLERRSAADLSAALVRYRSETEGTTVMHRLARGYTRDEIDAISAYLAGDQGRAQ
mgnify:CR=1 FL=1